MHASVHIVSSTPLAYNTIPLTHPSHLNRLGPASSKSIFEYPSASSPSLNDPVLSLLMTDKLLLGAAREIGGGGSLITVFPDDELPRPLSMGCDSNAGLLGV
jgi:hypothetical protein